MRGKDKQLGNLLPSIAPHIVARYRPQPPAPSVSLVPPPPTPHPYPNRQRHPLYPARAAVFDEQVSWEKPWEDYAPTHFEAEVLTKNIRGMETGGGWADPAEIGPELTEVIRKRLTFEGPMTFDDHGRPRNPRGRTGMTGRGTLGKWGPNQAADPIVTRFNPEVPGEL